MEKGHSTLSNYGEASGVLTYKDIQNAVQALEEASKRPFTTCIKSKTEWWETVKKSHDVRAFFMYEGIPVYKDESIPENIARFVQSDGTHIDVDFSVKPRFLVG